MLRTKRQKDRCQRTECEKGSLFICLAYFSLSVFRDGQKLTVDPFLFCIRGDRRKFGQADLYLPHCDAPRRPLCPADWASIAGIFCRDLYPRGCCLHMKQKRRPDFIDIHGPDYSANADNNGGRKQWESQFYIDTHHDGAPIKRYYLIY